MPVAWTDAIDKQMLLHLQRIHGLTNTKSDNQTIADAMGEGFTAEAVKKRMAKIRTGTADGTAAAPQTPAKAKKTPSKKAAGEGKGTGSKRKASAAKTTSDQAEAGKDEDEGASPSKKAKLVKEEVADDVD